MRVERASRAASVEAQWRSDVHDAAERVRSHAWPNPKWAADPQAFAWTILGVELWGKQAAILESVRDNRHTAVAGGRKVGKDFVAGVAGLWWYGSFEGARTVCFAPTMKLINEILYREIRSLWIGHGRCVKCKKDDPKGPRPCPHSQLMTGDYATNAAVGIRSPDMRQVFGMTGENEGGVIGLSGRILAIEDEATFMSDAIDTAIVGNLAASNTRRLMVSNPIKTSGFFFRAFHSERAIFGALFQISSEESPNIILGRDVFPGLATREWLEERAIAWRRGSPMWLWHVEGKFLPKGKGQLFGLEDIARAEMGWAEAEAVGRMHLGIDVAGENETGDEITFCPRRGNRAEAIQAERGLRADAILARARTILRLYRKPGDVAANRPVIILDRDGAEGARVFNVFRAYHEEHEEEFDLVGFRGGEHPKGLMGQVYKLNRDLLFGGLNEWVRDGGCFPVDIMLEAELVELRWLEQENRKNVLVRKDELRTILERSPDRADALALSTWGDVSPLEPKAKEPDELPTIQDAARVVSVELPGAYEAEDADGADLVYGGAERDKVYG